jgi:hypothetical protein
VKAVAVPLERRVFRPHQVAREFRVSVSDGALEVRLNGLVNDAFLYAAGPMDGRRPVHAQRRGAGRQEDEAANSDR